MKYSITNTWILNCCVNLIRTLRIRRYTDHMQFAAYMAVSFITFLHVLWVPCFFYHCIHCCMFCLILYIMYFYCYVYVFLLLCMFRSVYSVFVVSTGTLRLPWLKFSRAFSSVVRQMPGNNSQRWGMARTLPILRGQFIVNFSLTNLGSNPRKPSNQSCKLCCSMYCLCVNVYYTTATGCQLNCS